jgi:signal transduction histidine kinase
MRTTFSPFAQIKEDIMWRSLVRRLLLPCGFVALAVALEALLQVQFHQLVLTPSLAAVLLSVLYGGLTAGVTATFLSIVLMDLLFLEPPFSARTAAMEDFLQLIIFLMVALIVSSLSKERMARIKAEAQSKAKDDLLRQVAHELRTPMSSILGWTEILRRSPNSDSLGKACEVIERNAKMQMLLVDDLLDVARIVTGRLVLTRASVDLRRVIDAAVRIVQPSATNKGVLLLTPKPASNSGLIIEADERRLLQVLWNLMTNAVKFTPEHGTVRIATTVAEDCAVVDVTDSGVGISTDQLQRIFEKGEQGDNADMSGGLGLGLWIARSIIRLHGGDIEASSDEGHGSTFSVRVPLIGGVEEQLRQAQVQVLSEG